MVKIDICSAFKCDITLIKINSASLLLWYKIAINPLYFDSAHTNASSKLELESELWKIT